MLLLAGAVEGVVLGAAQARVLRRVLPALDVRWWVGLTAVAAVLAWAMGETASMRLDDRPGVPQVALAGVAVALLLLSMGGLQWVELRRHVARAWSWVGWTAAAWLLALAAFLAVATPLWHEAQPVGEAVAVGVGAGVLMAAVQAAVTGWGLVRLSGGR